MSYSFKSLVARRGAAALAAAGIGVVVFVFASMMMLSVGITKTMTSSGNDRNGIILSKNAVNELRSQMSDLSAHLVLADPNVMRLGNQTIGAAEVVGFLILTPPNGETAGLVARGVSEPSFLLRKQVQIVSGRSFAPGTDEVIVGSGVAKKLRTLFGTHIPLLGNRSLEVVGTFTAEGSSFESEMWGDQDTIRSIVGVPGIVSSITVRLESNEHFDNLQKAIESDPRLELTLHKEGEFYRRQSQDLALFIKVVGFLAALIFSVGAVLGAMTTMYAMVTRRIREIGTLRALGFEGWSIITAFLLEAVCLSFAGAAFGCLGLLGLTHARIEMANPATMATSVFTFELTPEVVVLTVGLALIIGVASGLSPAIRAARIPASQAMRRG